MDDVSLARFLSHVDEWTRLILPVLVGEPPGDECWPWRGAVQRDGYGSFVIGSARGQVKRQRSAHVWSFEHFRGPIPAGLVLDHIVCNRPPCVHPWHVEPSTQRDNVTRLGCRSAAALNAAKTHCPAGHAYDEANTYVDVRRGARSCRECKRIATREYQRRRRAQ